MNKQSASKVDACIQIISHDVDCVDIADCERLLHPAAAIHLDRYFSAQERAEIGSSGRRLEKLAGRLALKESVLKALGTGWGNGIAFTDVETATNCRGAPCVTLHRLLLQIQ